LSATTGIPLSDGGQTLPPPVSRGIPQGARRIAILAAVLLAIAIAGSWLTLGPASAVGAAAGGLLALANFWLLSRLVVRVTSGDDVHWAPLLGRLLFKLALLGFALWVMLVPLGLDFLGVVAGLSVVVAAAVFAQGLDLVG